jgi:predicted HAD superfamily Cof-like phosphohydrolase
MDYLEKVEEFHQKFGHTIAEEIEEDNLHVRKLRLNLIFEELVELAHAMGLTKSLEELCEEHSIGTHKYLFNNEIPNEEEYYNKVETLDALCDIQYVLSGAILSTGYKSVFNKAFNEVHQSNMSKMCESKKVAEDTIEYHKNKGETMDMNMVKVSENEYMILREDGKLLKSINYKEVDLKKYIS